MKEKRKDSNRLNIFINIDTDGGEVQGKRQKSPIFVSDSTWDISFYFYSGYATSAREKQVA